MKSNEYDVLVIGAGPAGSVAARHVALCGYKVLLIEKRPVVGVPVRCGEATGEREKLAIYAPVNEDFIETEITGAILHAPGGISIRAKIPRTTLMLDRLKFDPWMAHCAAEAGAELLTGARAKDVRPVQNGFREIPVDFEGAEHLVRARIVIGADGVEALSGRWTGLRCRMMPPTTCSAIELKLDVLDENSDCLTFWQGHDSINDGYVWSFPKAKSKTTNFGAGFITPRLHTPNILEVAMKWKEKFYPKANVTGCWGGAVPVSGVLEESVSDNFLL
ncbi:MAG TPA: NAD(P)/FAD-dependent oxidoreductase, partial [Fibrobacteraceae bacterium]|nr:NAD(P)/FAD-dependent oxidoreductase [Fibrobacteraceae bacterium]